MATIRKGKQERQAGGKEDQRSLMNLPYSVIKHLFQFLSQSDLFTASQVSQQFNYLVLVPELCRTMQVKYFHLQSDQFFENIFKPRSKFLKTLLIDTTVSAKELKAFLKLCPNLLKFELVRFRKALQGKRATNQEILSTLAKNCQQLRELVLTRHGIVEPDVVQQFVDGCKQLTSLTANGHKDVQLSSRKSLTHDVLKIMVKGLKNFSKLDCSYLDDGHLSIIPSDRITHLCLEGDATSAEVLKLLDRCPELKQFRCGDLVKCNDYHLIAEKLASRCRKLQSVKLNRIDSTKSLDALVRGCRQVEDAELIAGEKVDESILRTIGKYWQKLRSLEFDAAFEIKTKNILSAIGKCNRLIKFNIKFHDKTASEILANNIRCLPTQLQQFSIYSPSGNDAPAEAITQRLVNVTTVGYNACKFSTAAYKQLFDTQCLTDLTITAMKILPVDKAVIRILAESNCASTLQSVKLSAGINLEDESFEHFAKLKQLTKLTVSGVTKISDKAIEALVTCHEFRQRLQHLYVVGSKRESGAQFTNAVFNHLVKFSNLRACNLGLFKDIDKAELAKFLNNKQSLLLLDIKLYIYPDQLLYEIPYSAIDLLIQNTKKAEDNRYSLKTIEIN